MIHQRLVPSIVVTACSAAIGLTGSQGTAFAEKISGPFYTATEDVANREITRRQERMTQAKEAVRAGDELYSANQYEQSAAQYKLALDLLPDALATGTPRSEAMNKFLKASNKLAQQRIEEGRFGDAQVVIGRVLEYDPENGDAKAMLKHLAEPEYYNKTVGPKFSASVEEVKKYLMDAEGFYLSGRYDLAFKRYEQVLNIDPYNIAARRGQEKINNTKSEYGDQAYNEFRSRAMWQVSNAWQNPVTKFGLGSTQVITQGSEDQTGTARLTTKLNKIIIPQIEFKDATIREAIDYLKARSRELDDDKNPANRGVNIVLKLESGSGGGAPAPAEVPAAPVIPGLESTTATVTPEVSAAPSQDTGTPITLSLRNVPLIEALKYITSLANLKFKIEPYAVSIVPLSTPIDVLITKQYQVPPGFIGQAPAAPIDTAATGGDAAGTGSRIAGKQQAKDYLASQGVNFPPGASAIYQPNGSRLIVKNTQENLDFVDQLVQIALGDAPKQVQIESKFVEIQQINGKELSFDWQLGAFRIGSEGAYGTGGTQGTSPSLDGADYPGGLFNPSGTSPYTGLPYGTYPVTGGLRSGANAITTNAIDSLLNGLVSNSAKAPGIFGITGIFTDPQFQVVIRALDQKKGIDLLSSPSVTTKSGLRAVIEVVREFRYPTEFEPPELPSGNATASIVTPTTPTSFETRNTGVTLEVEPQVGPDGQTIELTLAPSVTEFEGFVNYGSPIFAPGGLVGNQQVVLTENVINQPIFSTRKVQTQVSIWDGQTVALGGLMREDVQKVEDKTPFLGDLPLIGRLFRSNADQHSKRNLVVFVTARLLNPAGVPLNAANEEEEAPQVAPLTELPVPASDAAPLPDFSK